MSSTGAQPTTPVKPKEKDALITNTKTPSSANPLSSAEILERVPTSVVRLLAAFSPLIHATNRFVRLATWTGGPGSSGSSVLLLVSWWIICSFGYEVFRYAPQVLILGWISYAWLKKQLSAAKVGGRVHDKHDVVSSSSINATLKELSELADFFSAFRRSILTPTVQLLSWDPSPNNTKAVAAFVLITWPLWIAAFLPWDRFGLPSLVLPVSGAAFIGAAHRTTGAAKSLAFRALGPQAVAAINGKLAPIADKWHLLESYVARTHLPAAYNYFLGLLSAFQLRRLSDFEVRVLPPYPIAALSVRSLLCISGTLALTWCSPWGALIRQAIWKSATLRRLVRGTGRILSGQRPFSSAWGVGHLDDEYTNALTHESLLRASTATSTELKKPADAADTGVMRHEDVIYQFSIFENQRWWVGLDWTAALLPQERPSWSDESNNPVSPPASFSLPPSRVTLTPSGAAFNRRTVKWQWLDPEWTIAGAASLLQDENAPEEKEEWNVDNDGWQYGDNAWDKMSKKAGMGRYTRRRKWVRRAVLVEVVETGVTQPAADGAAKEQSTPSPEAEKETESPASPGAAKRSELKDRLAKAAQ